MPDRRLPATRGAPELSCWPGELERLQHEVARLDEEIDEALACRHVTPLPELRLRLQRATAELEAAKVTLLANETAGMAPPASPGRGGRSRR